MPGRVRIARVEGVGQRADHAEKRGLGFGFGMRDGVSEAVEGVGKRIELATSTCARQRLRQVTRLGHHRE